MMIGDLFVALGVKGSDKAKKEVTEVLDSLKKTASAGIEAKAAILGAMYALERLFQSSGNYGTSLVNANAELGVSIKTLQQYQYAARQAGESNEAVTSSFANIQKIVTDIRTGKGAPESTALLSRLTGLNINELIASGKFNPEILIQKIQQAAQLLKNDPGLKNKLFADFGVQGLAGSLSRNMYRPEVLNAAPTYSDKEVGALDKARAAWSNLGTKIDMAVGHFNAEHGGEIVSNISKIVDKVLSLAEAFDKLAKKAELFKWLGKVFEGWEHIFTGLTKAIDYLNAQKAGDTGEEGTTKEQSEAEKIKADPKYVPDYLKNASPEAQESYRQDKLREAKSQESFGKAWDSFTSFITDEYGKHVLGIKEPEEPKAKKPLPTAPKYRDEMGGAVTVEVAQPPYSNTVKPKTERPPVIIPPKGAQVAPTAPAAPTAQVAPTAPAVQAAPVAPTAQTAPQAPVAQVAPTPTARDRANSAWNMPGQPPPAVKVLAPDRASAPGVPAIPPSTSSQTNNINQTLNFQHPGENARETGSSVKQAIQQAYRQQPAMARGN